MRLDSCEAALRKHLQEVEEGWHDLSVCPCAKCHNSSDILSADAVLELWDGTQIPLTDSGDKFSASSPMQIRPR